MKYRVRLERSVQRDLRRLSSDVRLRIVRAANALADNPRPPGYLKLHSRREQYRIRVGEYRIVYEIHDDILLVLVVETGHRSSIYD